jgi:hypothetical protein
MHDPKRFADKSAWIRKDFDGHRSLPSSSGGQPARTGSLADFQRTERMTRAC